MIRRKAFNKFCCKFLKTKEQELLFNVILMTTQCRNRIAFWSFEFTFMTYKTVLTDSAWPVSDLRDKKHKWCMVESMGIKVWKMIGLRRV